jgi:hypothetical protein
VNKHHPKIVAETQKQEEKIGEMDKFVISDQKENVSLIFIFNTILKILIISISI